MENSGKRRVTTPPITRLVEHSGTNQTVQFVRSRLGPRNGSYVTTNNASVVPNPKAILHFYDSAYSLCDPFPKRLSHQQLPHAGLTSYAKAFGREPNALPKLCNCLRAKSFGSPGR